MKKIIPFLLIIVATLCLAVKCDNNCIQCETDKATLQKKLNECNSKNTANLEKIATLTLELQTCNENNTVNDTKIASLTKQLDECNQATEVYRAKIAELIAQIDDCTDTVDLIQQLANCNAEKSALQVQIVLLNNDIQAYKDSLENCNDRPVTSRLWAYTYNLPNDSTVFNFWYSSEVSAPYQTRTSVGNLEFDQYYSIKGYERMYNKSAYKLVADAAYLEIILYDSTFNNVLYSGQFPLTEMLPKTEYEFKWNTGDYTLPYIGKYYVSKVLYEKKFFKDRPLEGGYFTFMVTNNLHTALRMKTYPETTSETIPNVKIYLNADTLYFPVKLDRVDSTYVVYINKAFDDIDSINFKTDVDLILNDVWLSSMNLLNNPAIKVKGITKIGNIYKILVNQPVTNPLVARWRFENNGNDELNTYPLTTSNPEMMYKNSDPKEGGYYLNTGNSSYIAYLPEIPLGDEFTISLYYKNWNQYNGWPIIGNGNGNVYSPDGYILYLDGADNKQFKFVTSDGTSNNRKYIMSVDNAWVRGTWNHIVITGSRTNNSLGKMYVNGVDVTSNEYTTGIFENFKTNSRLYVGGTVDSRGWCGIDDMRIYNRVLTAGEVSKLYNTGDIK